MQNIITDWIDHLNFEYGETIHSTQTILATRSYIYIAYRPFLQKKSLSFCIGSEYLISVKIVLVTKLLSSFVFLNFNSEQTIFKTNLKLDRNNNAFMLGIFIDKWLTTWRKILKKKYTMSGILLVNCV
jgi:hypothetical protein